MFEMFKNDTRSTSPIIDPGLPVGPTVRCMEHTTDIIQYRHSMLGRDYDSYGTVSFMRWDISNASSGVRFVLRKKPESDIAKPWLNLEQWVPSEVKYTGVYSQSEIATISDISTVTGLPSNNLSGMDLVWYGFIVDGVETYVSSSPIYIDIPMISLRDGGMIYGHTSIDNILDNPSFTNPLSSSKIISTPRGDFYMTVPKGANRMRMETDWSEQSYYNNYYVFYHPIAETMNSEWDQMRNALTGLNIGVS